METEEGQKLKATSPESDEPTSDPIGPGNSSGGIVTCPTRSSSSFDNTADHFTASKVDQNGLAPVANGRANGVSETTNDANSPRLDRSDNESLDKTEEKSEHDSSVDNLKSAADEQDATSGAKNGTEEQIDKKVRCFSFPSDSAVVNGITH